jgi:hypothetical protein
VQVYVCAWVCGYVDLVPALYEDPTILWADNCTYIRTINFWARNCLLDRECVVSWSTIVVENQFIGSEFRPSIHSFM